MKDIYFECKSGICGSMIVGALVNAGVNREELTQELKKLNIDDYDLIFEQVKKSSIAATRFAVTFSEDQKHRHLHHIADIINKSSLSQYVKETSIAIFTNLARAEANVHGITIEKVHFHEVGAVDAIMDIVGSVICLEKLNIKNVYSSPINTGSGWVNCDHGKMPVPAPATAELLLGIPVYAGDVESELTTPTGAAIISTLSQSFGKMPEMISECIGIGAGDKDFSIPNILRVFIGSVTDKLDQNSGLLDDETVQMESSIDDVSPEVAGFIVEELIRRNAFDAYYTPLLMKKNRPGFLLTVLCQQADVDALFTFLFSQGITLGIRYKTVRRKMIPRTIVKVATEHGVVRAKLGMIQSKIVYVTPEYEDCKAIALQQNESIISVMDEVKKLTREGAYNE